ncbi:MAG: Gfo/Idh/MocA family protein [Acidimicrobiales bacterium]
MSALRFGLLGTGYWALHAHGPALVASPHAELVGVWGRDPFRAAQAARQLGATSYKSPADLFAAVDAVAFALPPDVQASLALEAARAGLHLLLEKPLSLDLRAAEALVKAVDEARVATVVFFTQRFNPASEAWLSEAAQDGPWHSGHLVHYANIFQPGNAFGASPWRKARGALWDIGPHALSLVLPVMGPVSSVAARRGPVGSDTVHLVLAHGGPSGSPAAGTPVAVSTVSVSLTVPPAATANMLSLYGEKGVRTRPDNPYSTEDALAGAIHDLSEMVSTGQRAHRCDVRFGLEVVRALAAAERALDLPGAEL